VTATIFPTPLSVSIPNALKKKRVLLVDSSPAKRDLRAEVMRKLGMEVDCAADITEARCWWRADLYDLVLINVAKGLGHRDKFCEDILGATPRQQLAFLVGQPTYLAALPNADEEPAAPVGEDYVFHGEVKAALSSDRFSSDHVSSDHVSSDRDDLPQRWGILEASRRISSVRAASNARTRAMRDRPAPPRDPEGRPAKRSAAAITLDELLREELR
jgi:hypothetical protein